MDPTPPSKGAEWGTEQQAGSGSRLSARGSLEISDMRTLKGEGRGKLHHASNNQKEAGETDFKCETASDTRRSRCND